MLNYAERVREEIAASRPLKGARYRAFCHGLLLMGRRFDEDGIWTATEHVTVSKLYDHAVADIVGLRPDRAEQRAPRGATLHTLTVPEAAVSRLLEAVGQPEPEALAREEYAQAFLSGAFLSCGTISEPSKGYHLEFLPPNEGACDRLFELLSLMKYPPKSSVRRGDTVLYYKESEQIEDILTMMGAVKCSIELMELKIYKDLRNRANRATNCETANIDKLVRAAGQQLADIALLRERGLLGGLPEDLAALSALREEHPDASLSELSSLSGLSRSGVNRRLIRLGELARRAREESPG